MKEVTLFCEKLQPQPTKYSKTGIVDLLTVSLAIESERNQNTETTSIITRITIPKDITPKGETSGDVLRYIKISQRISLSENNRPKIKLTIKIPGTRKVYIKRVTVYEQFVITTTTEKTDISFFLRPLLRVLTKVDKFLFVQ